MNKVLHLGPGVMVTLLLTALLSCTEKTPSGLGNHEVVTEAGENGNDRIVIVDNTGKDWDVTHAVENYGFDPDMFQYGLGPYAILPYTDPHFYDPEDPEYPPTFETHIVIGYSVGNDVRAYPLTTMKGPEIVNDWYGDTPVAAGY